MNRHQWWLFFSRKLAILVLVLLALGELGHRVFIELHATVAHHIFHIVFGAGAVVVFSAYAIWDAYRNGLPTFSWHLRD